MTPAERAQQRLLALASTVEPSLRAAYLAALAALRPEQLEALTARLEAGDVDGAVALVFDRLAVTSALAATRAAFAEAVLRLARQSARDVSAVLRIRIQAPVLSPEIIAAVRRWEDEAFARVVADVRNGLRATIATELARGIGPRQVAVALKQGVSGGLTAYDDKIVNSYRAALTEGRFGDARRRALRDKRFTMPPGKTLTPAQIDKMVAAYQRKLVAFRAQTFARTAAIQAANDATRASWQAAVVQGAVPLAEVRQYWVVAADERLCPQCAPVPELNANGVGLNDSFLTPSGFVVGPTLHPNCRCVAYIRRERAGVLRAPIPGTTRLLLTQTA